MTDLLFKDLTHQIIGVYFDVYNGTSRTYPEFVYENAMKHDLEQQRIGCQRQEEYQIFYREWLVGRQRLDLFIAGEIIVEIKAVSQLTPLHKAQTISYLKAFDKQVGLLFNFGSARSEFERLFHQPHPSEPLPQGMTQIPAELPADLVSPDLVYDIIGGLYTVHNALGPGFIYRVYANACYRELQSRGLPVRSQKEMQVIYHGPPVAAIKFAHLQVGGNILVFPLAVGDINEISFNNIKEWLRLEQIPLAILANFHDLTLKPLILKVQ